MAIKLRKKTYVNSIDKLLESLELNSYAASAVITKLKEVLNIHSVNRLRGIYYFFVFTMNDQKNKTISSLYVKKSRARNFIKIEREEMLNSGAHPNEYKVFLEEIGSNKFDGIKDLFEKI